MPKVTARQARRAKRELRALDAHLRGCGDANCRKFGADRHTALRLLLGRRR